MEVGVRYDGVPMRGVVRNVLDRGDGTSRVGLEWQATGPRESGMLSDDGQLAGRLGVLFRMWETGQRDLLAQTVATLQAEADRSGLKRLAGRAKELLAAIDDGPGHRVGDALAALVDACTAADSD
jgi:hypothetical protein